MLDLAIVLAFVAYAVTSGFLARDKASESLTEYFLAGKTLKGWQAGTSMAATQFAADTPLLVTGLIATAGIFAVWRLWVYGLAFLLMAFVLAAHWRSAGVLTDAELTEIRYSGKGVLFLRVLKAVYYGTVINCVVLAMVLVAAVRIAEVFLPWHQWIPAAAYQPLHDVVAGMGFTVASGVTGIDPTVATTNNLLSILIIVGFTALYSMTGGLRSVVATDVVQFTLAMVGTLFYAVIVVREAGGLGGMTDRLVEMYGTGPTSEMLSWAPPPGEALMPFLVVVGLQWFFQMNSDGTGYLAQRSMACETTADARTAGVVFAWLQIFFRSLLWLVIAVGLLILYPIGAGEAGTEGFAAAREILFVVGIDDYLPVGIRGLMLTGLLAALASTVDTHLNWGASYWSNDVYKRLIADHWQDRTPDRRELVVVARLSNVFILGIALVLMVNLGSIQTAWFVSLLFGAGMGAVLVLRWLWERINLYSEMAAILVSLVAAPVLLQLTDQEWIRLGSMSLISSVAAVGVTFFTRGTEPEVLKEFYRRVEPDGFWRVTAQALGRPAGAPVLRFWRGMGYTVLTAASLFLLLAGVGRLLIPGPGMSDPWSWVMVGIGLGITPFWWRGVSSQDDELPGSAVGPGG